MPEPSVTPSDSSTSYLADLLANTRDELSRGDSKASLILAASGVIIGALVGGIASSGWRPTSLGVFEQVLWWAGVGAAAAGLFLTAASVYPRTGRRGTPHAELPAYYGDVATYPDIESFRQALDTAPDPSGRLIHQVYVLSMIVQRKYVHLRRGMLCLLVATVACVLAVGFQALL
jgi:hypothetical protein